MDLLNHWMDLLYNSQAMRAFSAWLNGESGTFMNIITFFWVTLLILGILGVFTLYGAALNRIGGPYTASDREADERKQRQRERREQEEEEERYWNDVMDDARRWNRHH